MACPVVARARGLRRTARLRAMRFGEAAFARLVTIDCAGLPSRSSREGPTSDSPPSRYALRRGSLRSLRFGETVLAGPAEAREASEGWWGKKDSNLRSHTAA